MRPSETWAARSYGSGCGGLNADAREQAEAVASKAAARMP